MEKHTRPQSVSRTLFGKNIPKNRRRPHHSATWPVVITLCVLISLIGVVMGYIVIGKAVMNMKCGDLWVWMAQPNTVFQLEADGKTKTITNADWEMRQLEIVLMYGETYKLPVGKTEEAITLTIENELGRATLELWLQDHGIAMRWQPQGERPFTGQFLGHRQKAAFQRLRELLLAEP